jgi:arylsulfatase A-like enzyme
MSKPMSKQSLNRNLRCALMVTGGWLVATALAAASLNAKVPAAVAQRPNIVILVADDWGFSDLGAFGGEIATPHLDALAHKGVRFSNFHTAASCSPTRSMLLTGVESHRAGIGNLRESTPRAHLSNPAYQGSLSQRVVTVSSLLKDSGYRTYITGKWNVGSEPRNLPPQRGFDRSIVQGDTGSDNWDPQQRYLPHGPKVNWYENGQPAVMPPKFYSSEYFVDRMIGYLDQDKTSPQPFLAYVGFQANHVPVQAPSQFIAKYKGRYDQGWTVLREARRDSAARLGIVPAQTPMVNLPTTQDWQAQDAKSQRYQARRMEVYAAMAEAMDHQVGRLVAHLKANGQYDNTVFLFLSDNGAEGSDYDMAQAWLMTQYSQDIDRLGGPGAYSIQGPSWASASVSPLNGFKFFAGEGGIRVPMFIAGAGVSNPSAIHRGLTHVTDIAPTLLAMAGIERPAAQYQGQNIEPMSGHNLLPVLQGQTQAVRGRDEILGYELSGNAALFKGPLKLVKNLAPLGDGQWRLFDIETDPGETRDLQKEKPLEFAAMQKDYQAWADAQGVLPVPSDYNPVMQVTINTVMDYWLPHFGPWIAAGLFLPIAAWLAWRRRKA